MANGIIHRLGKFLSFTSVIVVIIVSGFGLVIARDRGFEWGPALTFIAVDAIALFIGFGARYVLTGE